MKTYTCKVTKTVSYKAVVEIDAESKDEAFNAAFNMHDLDFEWKEVDELQRFDIEVADEPV